MENSIKKFSITFVNKVYPKHNISDRPQENSEVKVEFTGDVEPEKLSILINQSSDLMTTISRMNSRSFDQEPPNYSQAVESENVSTANSDIFEPIEPIEPIEPEEKKQEIKVRENDIHNAEEEVVVQGAGVFIIAPYHDTILKAWHRCTGVDVKGRTKKYRVVFPSVQDSTPFGPIYLYDSKMADSLHSWPICSCESYYYRTIYCCRHIRALLDIIKPRFYDQIDWSRKPNNLPAIMRDYGVERFQWIPK